MKHYLRAIAALFFIICTSLSIAQSLRAAPDVKLPPKDEFVSKANSDDSAPNWDADEVYDRANPDLHKLQRSRQALAGFAVDKKGSVDWMTALRSGAIAPRADLSGNEKMQVLDLDIVMKNTKEMPHVKFPHNSHTQWLTCGNCHDKLFTPKAGANAIDMTKIFSGQYCGACHDRVAFRTFFSCERCHSVPQGETKQWW